MTVAGIIAEYNPFHNGHAYHLAATREAGATHIVAVMGGYFTQRGTPALLPKADRVKMALAGGADLIIELQLPWATATAERFAFGGVSLLENMGCVDRISFGCEAGEIQPLNAVIKAVRDERFPELLRSALKQGISYPEAQQRAVAALTDQKTAAVLSEPNNTLGIEYGKALLALQSSLVPCPVLRQGVTHDAKTPKDRLASAGWIRTNLLDGGLETVRPFIPKETADILEDALKNGGCLTDAALADRLMLSYLRRLDLSHFAALPGVSEGLHNRLYTAVQTEGSLKKVIEKVKTRRYTAARLRRIVTAAYLGIPATWEQEAPPYIRVLGFNQNGRELLQIMKKTARLPLISDPQQLPDDPFAKEIFELECKASNLYGSMLPCPPPCGQEFTVGMIRY